MKKILALIAALSLAVSCAAAGSFSDAENFVFSFNAWADTLGADALDMDNALQQDNMTRFTCSGYDVIISEDETGKISQAGIRLISDSASGDFLAACMVMIATLGDMDYAAFGQMLAQYGEVKKGETDILPGFLGADNFSMSSGTGDFKMIFVYLNNDLQGSI